MSTAEKVGGLGPRADVVAAGCVVLRPGPGGHEVLLVHRPRYDDWSFPKGKVDRGETLTTCAVREVEEESGVRVGLGLPLTSQRYLLANGRPKAVHYWIARPTSEREEAFVPNDEVDEVRWLSWEHAHDLLSYEYDRDTLREARAQRRRTDLVVVVRQPERVERAEWTHAHPGAVASGRPLSPAGREQGRRLAADLAAFPAGRYLVGTGTAASRAGVTAAAEALGWTPLDVPRVEAPQLGRLARESGVLCLVARRRLVEQVLAGFGCADAGGTLAKGEWVAIHHRGGQLLAVERRQEPRPAQSPVR